MRRVLARNGGRPWRGSARVSDAGGFGQGTGSCASRLATGELFPRGCGLCGGPAPASQGPPARGVGNSAPQRLCVPDDSLSGRRLRQNSRSLPGPSRLAILAKLKRQSDLHVHVLLPHRCDARSRRHEACMAGFGRFFRFDLRFRYVRARESGRCHVLIQSLVGE